MRRRRRHGAVSHLVAVSLPPGCPCTSAAGDAASVPCHLLGRGCRLVIVTNRLMVGGAETQIMRLAARLIDHGYELGILSILPTSAFQDEADALGIPITYVNFNPSLRALSMIVSGTRLLAGWRPDIVVSFLYQANILARVAGTLTRVPVIISSIRNERFGGRGRELMMRATTRLCAVTTTNSEVAARSLVRRKVVPEDRLLVIPNGLEADHYRSDRHDRAAIRGALSASGEGFLWLSVGRLEPQKDVANLLDAFARHVRSFPTAQLRIAGEGALLDELEARARSLGVEGRVRFLGVRHDVPGLLAAADGFVLSSAWEGLPNAVMEALAAGCPVVATDVGGTAELVDDAVTGYLPPPRDSVALAAAMDRLAGLPLPARAAMGRRAQEAVAARFSFDDAAARWLSLISGCWARTGRPPRSPRPPMRAGTPPSRQGAVAAGKVQGATGGPRRARSAPIPDDM